MSPTRTDPVAARLPSQPQRVVDGVAGRILSGALRPGERVPTEPALMQEFGVSRSVVREALSRLQASGLVRTRQGVGSFVLSPQPPEGRMLDEPQGQALQLQQKLAMLELRLSVESDAAALAAQRRTPAHLVAMEQALQDFVSQESTGEGTAEADFRFHEAVAQATGNEYFVRVLRSLSGATIPRVAVRAARRPQAVRPPRFGDPSPQLRSGKDITAQEHQAVLEAIRRGDASAARAAMFMHLNNSRERMKNVKG